MSVIFLTLSEVLEIHADVLATAGGQDGILNQGGLESALAAPQATYGGSFLNEFPFEMAAALALSFAKNHAFADGNKRTTSMVLCMFLFVNGYELTLTPEDFTLLILDVATGVIKKAQLAGILRASCRKR